METLLQQFRLKLMGIGPLSPAAWEQLRPCMELVTCKKNHPVRDWPGDFYYIGKGLLKEEYDQHSKILVTRFIKEDDPLFIPLRIYQGSLIALENTRMLRLSREKYLEARKAFPFMGDHFEVMMADWYQLLIIRIELTSLPKRNRLKSFKTTFPGLASRILKKDIASFLEMSIGYFSENQ